MNIITEILVKPNGFGKLLRSHSIPIACTKVGTLHDEIAVPARCCSEGLEILFDETGDYLEPRIHFYNLTVRADRRKSGGEPTLGPGLKASFE